MKNIKDINIERVEQKVDLILKILLDLCIYDVGYPYDYRYLSNYSDELALLYNLDVVKDKHKIQFPAIKEIKETQVKLRNLQEEYKTGNYVAKDKEDIKEQINNLKKKTKFLSRFQKNRERIEIDLKEVNKDAYNIQTYLELRKKVGLPEILEENFSVESDLDEVGYRLDKLKKGYHLESYDPENH
ncbi:hypothetical protein LCGC14_1864500 [marine sediment metagenome]|uniref:Uncharacterized protein n=1 Tax=marine sediment metagenome TaxID=412755 RepID=A0A0F9GUV5_9ZZZZ